MLSGVDSQGVNWWGYAEGNVHILATLGALFIGFATAYLIQRFRVRSSRGALPPIRQVKSQVKSQVKR